MHVDESFGHVEPVSGTRNSGCFLSSKETVEQPVHFASRYPHTLVSYTDSHVDAVAPTLDGNRQIPRASTSRRWK